MNPSSRVPVCRSERQHSGRGSLQHLARKDLWSQACSRADKVRRPAGQSLRQPMPREISMVWSSTLMCGARLSQQWSGPAPVIPLRVLYSTLLGLFDKCLGSPPAKWGICPGACRWYTAILLHIPNGKWGVSPGSYRWAVVLCRPGCSGHVCRYLKCVSLPDVFTLT